MRYQLENSDVVLTDVHEISACFGRACPVHRKSDHSMREWPQHFRWDNGLMERICPEHGVGHPDPDALPFFRERGIDGMGIHGCCGCCRNSPHEPLDRR